MHLKSELLITHWQAETSWLDPVGERRNWEAHIYIQCPKPKPSSVLLSDLLICLVILRCEWEVFWVGIVV